MSEQVYDFPYTTTSCNIGFKAEQKPQPAVEDYQKAVIAKLDVGSQLLIEPDNIQIGFRNSTGHSMHYTNETDNENGDLGDDEYYVFHNATLFGEELPPPEPQTRPVNILSLSNKILITDNTSEKYLLDNETGSDVNYKDQDDNVIILSDENTVELTVNTEVYIDIDNTQPDPQPRTITVNALSAYIRVTDNDSEVYTINNNCGEDIIYHDSDDNEVTLQNSETATINYNTMITI